MWWHTFNYCHHLCFGFSFIQPLMVPNAGSWASWEVWPGEPFLWWSMQAFFLELTVPSRKPAARSSKSITTQCGQMTTRLVWRPTSFHNMWPGLLNWRQGLREKIFPRTKSDLAAGGPWSCEWAASAKDCGARRKHSIFLHLGDSPAPPTGSIYQWYLAGWDA